MTSDLTTGRVGGNAPVDAAEVLAGQVDAVTVHDAEGRYLWVSRTFTSLLDVSVDDLVGQDPYTLGLMHPDDVERLVEVQSDGLATREPWRVTYRMRRADGQYVWVESTGRVLRLGDEDCFVITTRPRGDPDGDSSTDVGRERALQARLQELVHRQQRFLTTVSHRARTPLTAVLGMAEVLHRGAAGLAPDQARVLTERLVANARDLAQLLEVITDADQLSRGDVVLERRVVELRRLVEEVVDRVAAAPGAVDVQVAADVRPVVDRDQVSKVLAVLISNAFAHGGPDVSVTVQAEPDGHGVVLVVEDDGVGVPAPLRREVFRPFERGDAEDVDPGAGLGLYIVAEMAALHGGRATVEEGPAGGACFRVHLPGPRSGWEGVAPALDGPGRTSRLTPDTHRFVMRLLATIRAQVGLQVAYLTLFEGDDQVVLAVAGDGTATGIEPGMRIPLAESYCVRMLAGEVDRVIPDTSVEPHVAQLAATQRGLRSYIGVPVHLPSGQVLGTLCCADGEARPELSQATAEELLPYAAVIGGQLEREGFIDRGLLETGERVAQLLARPERIGVDLSPVVDLATGAVDAVTAIPRFGDTRPPDLWFADAARTGMAAELELLVGEAALARLQELSADTRLVLSLSPRTVMGPYLPTLLESAPLERLVLEVTGRAALGHAEFGAALAPHRRHGLQVAVRGLGAGSAALGHVFGLRPDGLGVDPTVVAGLADDPVRRAVVDTLTRVADDLGASLVAEGVRDVAGLTAAAGAGCSHARGPVLGRAADGDDLEALIEQARSLVGD